jgi:hypothetical protein
VLVRPLAIWGEVRTDVIAYLQHARSEFLQPGVGVEALAVDLARSPIRNTAGGPGKLTAEAPAYRRDIQTYRKGGNT